MEDTSEALIAFLCEEVDFELRRFFVMEWPVDLPLADIKRRADHHVTVPIKLLPSRLALCDDRKDNFGGKASSCWERWGRNILPTLVSERRHTSGYLRYYCKDQEYREYPTHHSRRLTLLGEEYCHHEDSGVHRPEVRRAPPVVVDTGEACRE